MRELPTAISDFVERHEDRDRRQLTFVTRLEFRLRLPIYPAGEDRGAPEFRRVMMRSVPIFPPERFAQCQF
jgi:hypothetical protein